MNAAQRPRNSHIQQPYPTAISNSHIPTHSPTSTQTSTHQHPPHPTPTSRVLTTDVWLWVDGGWCSSTAMLRAATAHHSRVCSLRGFEVEKPWDGSPITPPPDAQPHWPLSMSVPARRFRRVAALPLGHFSHTHPPPASTAPTPRTTTSCHLPTPRCATVSFAKLC